MKFCPQRSAWETPTRLLCLPREEKVKLGWFTVTQGGLGVRGEPDLQRQQQLDGVGEGRGSGQAQQAERSEEKQVGEGPGEGQGVAGAETRQEVCCAGCRRSCLGPPWLPAADPTPHRPPSETGEGGVWNEQDWKSCGETHSNRTRRGGTGRQRVKTLHPSICFWEGGGERGRIPGSADQ